VSGYAADRGVSIYGDDVIMRTASSHKPRRPAARNASANDDHDYGVSEYQNGRDATGGDAILQDPNAGDSRAAD